MDTDQLNIRVSKSILFDLEFIARATGLSKNEWLRYAIALRIRDEKEELLRRLEQGFIMERITADEFKEKTGYAPRETLQMQRQTHRDKIMAATRGTDARPFAREALLGKLTESVRGREVKKKRMGRQKVKKKGITRNT